MGLERPFFTGLLLLNLAGCGSDDTLVTDAAAVRGNDGGLNPQTPDQRPPVAGETSMPSAGTGSGDEGSNTAGMDPGGPPAPHDEDAGFDDEPTRPDRPMKPRMPKPGERDGGADPMPPPMAGHEPPPMAGRGAPPPMAGRGAPPKP